MSKPQKSFAKHFYAMRVVPHLTQMLARLSPQQRRWVTEAFCWIPFGIVLVWFYPIPPWMWTSHMPGYFGDIVEALWQIDLWRNAVLTFQFDPVTPSAYPVGLNHLSIGHAGTGLLLLPLSLPFGSAFALNAGWVGGLVLAFIGARAFLRHFTSSHLLPALAATVFTFALGRTLQTQYNLNLSLGTALATCMGALLLDVHQRTAEARPAIHLAIAAGLCWGLSIVSQPYLLFIAAPLFILLGKQWQAWKFAPITLLTALAVSGPFLFGIAQALSHLEAHPPSLLEVANQSATPFSYIGWGPFSLWQGLVEITAQWRQAWTDIPFSWARESTANWGLIFVPLTAASTAILLHARAERRFLILLVVALVLSLGPAWIDPPFSVQPFKPINSLIWQVSQQLKPALFDSRSAHFQEHAVPLPAIVPLTAIPRLEHARFINRFSSLVSLAVIALAVIALSRLPRAWAIAITCLWVIELLPLPRPSQPVPTHPHPVHIWAARTLQDQDRAVHEFLFFSRYRSNFYSRELVRLPNTGIIAASQPTYMAYLSPWTSIYVDTQNSNMKALAQQLLTNPHQLAKLRRAQVALLLLPPDFAKLAQHNPHLRFHRCFQPGLAEHYYPKPNILCAFSILPDPDEFFSIQPVRGFSVSDFEPPNRFVWVEGTYAKAGWRISQPVTHTIELSLRAFCPTNPQSVTISLNGQPIVSHTWTGDCWQPWSTKLTIPPGLIKPGWNTLEFNAAYAAQPVQHLPDNLDSRFLSVGVERLRVMLLKHTH